MQLSSNLIKMNREFGVSRKTSRLFFYALQSRKTNTDLRQLDHALASASLAALPRRVGGRAVGCAAVPVDPQPVALSLLPQLTAGTRSIAEARERRRPRDHETIHNRFGKSSQPYMTRVSQVQSILKSNQIRYG